MWKGRTVTIYDSYVFTTNLNEANVPNQCTFPHKVRVTYNNGSIGMDVFKQAD